MAIKCCHLTTSGYNTSTRSGGANLRIFFTKVSFSQLGQTVGDRFVHYFMFDKQTSQGKRQGTLHLLLCMRNDYLSLRVMRRIKNTKPFVNSISCSYYACLEHFLLFSFFADIVFLMNDIDVVTSVMLLF